MEAQNRTNGTMELTNAQKMLVEPLINPALYVEITKNAPEKQEIVNLLRKFTVIDEKEVQTGISGTYKVGNEYIQIAGSFITTGLKKTKSASQYLGMSGHKRWYGGGANYTESPKTKRISIFDDCEFAAFRATLLKKVA